MSTVTFTLGRCRCARRTSFNYSPEFTFPRSGTAIPSSKRRRSRDTGRSSRGVPLDLSGLLRVGRRDLLPVVEHVETKVHGILVREGGWRCTAMSRRTGCCCKLCSPRGQAQQELRAYLDRACDAGVEPVVVLADPQDTVDTVFEQR